MTKPSSVLTDSFSLIQGRSTKLFPRTLVGEGLGEGEARKCWGKKPQPTNITRQSLLFTQVCWVIIISTWTFYGFTAVFRLISRRTASARAWCPSTFLMVTTVCRNYTVWTRAISYVFYKREKFYKPTLITFPSYTKFWTPLKGVFFEWM